MTPKEKAKELVLKYQSIDCIFEHKDTDGMCFYLEGKMVNSTAKQCASRDTNETIEAMKFNSWQNRNEIEFYEDVKKEIELL